MIQYKSLSSLGNRKRAVKKAGPQNPVRPGSCSCNANPKKEALKEEVYQVVQKFIDDKMEKMEEQIDLIPDEVIDNSHSIGIRPRLSIEFDFKGLGDNPLGAPKTID